MSTFQKCIVLAAFVLGLGMRAALAQDLREGGVIFPDETKAARDIAWLPDGERLAVLHSGGKIDIRGVTDGQVSATFGGGDPKADRMWVSPDGRFVAVWSSDWTLRVWHVAGSRLVAELQEIDSMFMPTFSPDGRFLAVLRGRFQVLVLSLAEEGRVIARLESTGQFRDGVFSPDSQTLVTTEFGTGEDGPDLLKIWSFDVARERVRVAFKHWQLRWLNYVPGGKAMAVSVSGEEANPERTMVILDAESGAITNELDVPGKALGRPSFDRNGTEALINVLEGAPTLWRLPDWLLEPWPGDTAQGDASAGFVGGGPMIMTRSDRDGLRFFAGREPIEILHRGPYVGSSRMSKSEISPDGRRLAVLAKEMPPEIWSLDRVNALGATVEGGDENVLLAEAEARDKEGNTRGAEDVWGLITLRYPGTPAAATARDKLDEKMETFRAAMEAGAQKQAREDEATLSAFTGNALSKDGWLMGCLDGTNLELDVPEEELRPACGCMYDEMKKRLSPEHFLNLYFAMSAAPNKLIAAATRQIIHKEQGLGTYVSTLQSVTEDVKKACPFTWGH